VRDGQEGTSNVGSVGDRDGRSAGEATNVVTDYALVRGESRSHSRRFAAAITAAYRQAFRAAARLRPTDAPAHCKVGECLAAAGDRPGAAAANREARRCQPDRAEARDGLARLGEDSRP
jgi:metal-dependent amidase/aminoacylase/carboxypeptidase family protein